MNIERRTLFALCCFFLLLPVCHATKPGIPWQVELEVQQLSNGRVQLDIVVESAKNAKNLSISVIPTNISEAHGELHWFADLEKGVVYKRSIEFSYDPNGGDPAWRVTVEGKSSGVSMTRIANVGLSSQRSRQKQQTRYRVINSAQEYLSN